MSRWSTFSHRQQGLLLTGGGAIIMAPDALLIKVADLPDAEILMWRGFLSGLGFLLIALARYGRGTLAAYRRCGWTGIAVALLFSLTTCGFVLGNQYTKAGNVLMILASSPIIAAVLSWIILKPGTTSSFLVGQFFLFHWDNFFFFITLKPTIE